MPEDREYFGFALFYNEKRRSPKAPEYTGNGKLDPKVIDYIIAEHRAGRNPELEIVGWIKTSRKGTKFQSVSVNVPYDQRRNDRDDRDDRRDDRRDERSSRDDRDRGYDRDRGRDDDREDRGRWDGRGRDGRDRDRDEGRDRGRDDRDRGRDERGPDRGRDEQRTSSGRERGFPGDPGIPNDEIPF